ncbi:MAG TPA: hypothetical protein ENI73_03120 [Spirochaetes bacterium]|nr:hypothetical protein [Spirochaetota bacterium]
MKTIDVLKYKGYEGTIEYSKADGCYYGQVIAINGLVSYEGSTKEQLEDDFKNAVEDYLSN